MAVDGPEAPWCVSVVGVLERGVYVGGAQYGLAVFR